MKPILRTWMIEAAIVFVVIFMPFLFKKFQWSEFLASLAVMMTFKHAQISDRMQELQALMPKPDIHCYRWSNRYFFIKEILWISFFLKTKSYAALLGSFIFFLYPIWRKLYNKHWRSAKKRFHGVTQPVN